MAWLSILLMIIQYGPQIFALVSEIIDLIKKHRADKQAGLRGDLAAAVATYRVSRDQRPLRELRDRLYAALDAK